MVRMLRIGVGQSIHPSPEKAAREAIAMAMTRAEIERADLVLLFATASYHPNFPLMIKTIRERAKASYLVGCSAHGVITTDGEWEGEPAVAVMVMASDTIAATPFFLHPLQDHPDRIGQTIGKLSARDNEDPTRSSLTVVLPDTYTFQPKPFYDGIHAGDPRAIVIGGGASEDGSLMQTLQIYQDQIRSDAVTGFVLRGPFASTIGITQACHPIGKPMMVTRSRDNTIYELAGRPALECYSTLFSKVPPEDVRTVTGMIFVGFPSDPAETRFTRGSYLVRNVIGVDPKKGSITLPEVVEEGQVISFVLREPNEAVRDMESMLSDLAKIHHDRPPRLALYFACCGRGRSLYGKTGVDLSLIKKHLNGTPIIGFFTYAEIGPIHSVTQYHNYSGVLGLLGE
jgi:small ligand-binding sensory domain FIST